MEPVFRTCSDRDNDERRQSIRHNEIAFGQRRPVDVSIVRALDVRAQLQLIQSPVKVDLNPT